MDKKCKPKKMKKITDKNLKTKTKTRQKHKTKTKQIEIKKNGTNIGLKKEQSKIG